MLKQDKRGKSALVFALLLGPMLAYAVWMLAVILLDTFQGDGLLQHQYFFESRPRLAWLLLSDARQALPVFYLVGCLLWLEIHFLSRYSEPRGPWLALAAGALTGFVIAAVLVEVSLPVLAPAVLSALPMSLLLAWAIQPTGLQG